MGAQARLAAIIVRVNHAEEQQKRKCLQDEKEKFIELLSGKLSEHTFKYKERVLNRNMNNLLINVFKTKMYVTESLRFKFFISLSACPYVIENSRL